MRNNCGSNYIKVMPIIFEYGWNVTWLTLSTCPLKVCLTTPAFISNNRAVWSIEADTKKSPVSWKSTAQTGYTCYLKVCVHTVFTKSHTFIVQSPDDVIKWVPLGWKFIPLTQSLCPSPL